MRSGEQPPLLSKHLVATACTLRLDTNSSWAGPQDVNIATDVIPAVIFESPLILHVHIYINIHIQTHKCTYTIYIYTIYIHYIYTIYILYIYNIYIYYIYNTNLWMFQINLPLVQYHLPSPLESLDLMECIHCGRNFNQQALKRRGMAMAMIMAKHSLINMIIITNIQNIH